MAPESLADLLHSLPRGPAPAPVCRAHPEAPAVRICSRCGTYLCRGCAPAWEATPCCGECRRGLAAIAARCGACFGRPVLVLAAVVVVLMLGYAALARGRFAAFRDVRPGRPGEDRAWLEQRTWLYLVKAARSKFYAGYLSGKGRPDLARRRYAMASAGIEQALAGTEELRRMSEDQSLEAEFSERLASLRISLGECHAREGRRADSIRVLERALAGPLPPQFTAPAQFSLGQALESSPADYAKAIAAYAAAQQAGERGDDHMERILQAAEKPLHERRLALVLHQLRGSFQPAEAQARVIACHEALGEKEKAEEAREVLLERYSFSAQAEALRKERGEAPRATRAGRKPADEPDEPEKEGGTEETLKIVPLEK